MKSVINECVQCSLPCIYEECKYYKTERYYCDECHEEAELYIFDDEELCEHCILERFEKVEGSFYY